MSASSGPSAPRPGTYFTDRGETGSRLIVHETTESAVTISVLPAPLLPAREDGGRLERVEAMKDARSWVYEPTTRSGMEGCRIELIVRSSIVMLRQDGGCGLGTEGSAAGTYAKK